MSSLRNAVKRVTHKERSQPQNRTRLGLLEKKKDYKLRSRDFHAKQDRLRSMREKVANRNPDEFYFGMHRSKVDGGATSGRGTGRHVRTDEGRAIDAEKGGLGPEGVRIMKDQDLAYVRMRMSMDERKVERMQGSLHYLENDDDDHRDGGGSKGGRRRHTVFVGGGRGGIVGNFDAARHFDTAPELVGRAFNRPRLGALLGGSGAKVPPGYADDEYHDDGDEGGGDDGDDVDTDEGPKRRKPITGVKLLKMQRRQKKLERAVAKSRSAAYSEMELRRKRIEKLRVAEAHLVSEKQGNMKGRKRKIGEGEGEGGAAGGGGDDGGKPALYKWRRKRAK